MSCLGRKKTYGGAVMPSGAEHLPPHEMCVTTRDANNGLKALLSCTTVLCRASPKVRVRDIVRVHATQTR